MCLNTITKTYEVPDTKVRTAYKILEKGNKTPFQFTKLPMGEWVSAIERKLAVENRGQPFAMWEHRPKYTSGFHVYPTRSAARKALSLLSSRRNRTIRKVEVREITYEGTDGTGFRFTEHKIPNLVARWIRQVPGKV